MVQKQVVKTPKVSCYDCGSEMEVKKYVLTGVTVEVWLSCTRCAGRQKLVIRKGGDPVSRQQANAVTCIDLNALRHGGY